MSFPSDNKTPLDPSTFTRPAPPPPPVPAPEPEIPPPATRKRWLIPAVIAGLIGVIILATVYSAYLTTKVAVGKKFRLTTPRSVVAGEQVELTWDTSPENITRYPREKIEFCTKKKLFGYACRVLAANVANNGRAVVILPNQLSGTKGYFRFTARGPAGLFHTISIMAPVEIKVAPEPEGSGGGGSAASGGAGSANSNATTSTNPYAPADPYVPTDPYTP